MPDIDKIRVLHDIKTSFDNVDSTFIDKLAEQISDLSLRNNTDRFFRTFKIEFFFQSLYSSFPWVKLLHGLDETQHPSSSKAQYQVPDFMLFFESSSRTINPILVDVKSVQGDKMTLSNIMSKQVDVELRYAETLNVPFYYAIYWEKFQTWTLNSIECFTKKAKSYKLDFINAFRNDLFIVLGDQSFLIDGKFLRKTICDPSMQKTPNVPFHHKHGVIMTEFLSVDGKEWKEVSALESSVIDSNVRMKEISVVKDESTTTFIEESEAGLLLKTSTMVLRDLAIFGIELSPEYANAAMHGVLNVMKILERKPIYMVPRGQSADVDSLMKKAFGENSSIYRNYRDRGTA